MSDERPWEDYADPLALPPRGAAGPAGASAAEVGYGEDIAKGTAGGLGRMTAGTLGLGGTLGNVARWGAGKAGIPEAYIDTAAKGAKALGGALPALGFFTGPDAGQVQSKIEEYTGKFYEPKTIPGQYASTIAEFAPGMFLGGGGIIPRVVNTVLGAIGSETAGQITKGTAAEPYARFAGGFAGGFGGGRAITPTAPASPARQAAVATLEREGIPVTAGQRTGSKPIQWLEATAADMPGSAGRAAELQGNQAAAYERAITDRVFPRAEIRQRGIPDDASLPRPDVMNEGMLALGDRFNQISGANVMQSSPQLRAALDRRVANYQRDVLPSMRTNDVPHIRDNIFDQLLQGQGQIPGGVYQHTRSRLGKAAKATTDTELATALRGMRDDLDAAFARGLPPGDAARWADTNRRYANAKQIESAVAAASENLSPQRVAQAVRSRRAGQAARGQGDLDELARAASMVIKPMPQSGTAPRTAWQSLFNLPTMLASGGGLAGSMLGPLGIAAGAALPFAASRLALSGPVQRYLGNQAMPQNARDMVAQTLMQQAVSQPSGVDRNRAQREAYDKKRADELRRLGLR